MGSGRDARDAESLRPITPNGLSEKVLSPKPAGPVTWMSLPRKDQLLILFVSRLVDFLQVASLQAYVFYQLKDINRELTDAQISQQAGLLQGCFTGAQVMTAILWGKAADASWCGRKWVLVIGLGGTAVSCLGYGFATTFFWAAFWRAFGGAINGTVGIIRTMVAEFTKEKRYQSRAFLILPMSFNVAGILGPIMGGMLAEPHKTLPSIFGEGAILGFQWIRDYPFALPSLMNALFLTLATAVIYLFLEETLEERRGKPDYGLELGSRLKQKLFGTQPHTGYAKVTVHEDIAMEVRTSKPASKPARPVRRLPFYRLWTRNVIFTLITGAFYDFHLGAFTNIWSLFLSTPRYVNVHSEMPAQAQRRDLPLLFTGGMGMPASTVGFATSFLGILGMLLQIFLYPPIQARLGTLRSFQWFLFLFPIAYFVAPYLAILPSSTAPPEPSSGALIWMGIIFVLLLQVTARTFTLPASIILLNNCSPHPSVLGTIHGLGQSVSAGFRTVGPVVGGWWYGYGLDIGMVAWGWWGVAFMSAACCVTALGMHEGSGHEVVLEGEDEKAES
ncbi:major facilitator superfamily domain-containing protein [Stachybotrys elegans]|uniref:Major facilitator superfamily domain-containing protein n=1 Tax=Stachybotrys elegans TaxID=80388 RepID=A0A8K0SEZ6_9HYPO|nr:major facilitator superfamily domain-containing protein [Stachybotrys elegans]